MNAPQRLQSRLQNSKSFLTMLSLLACLIVLIGSLLSCHMREHNIIHARRLHDNSSGSSVQVRSTSKSGCGQFWHPSASSPKTWCVSLYDEHNCCNSSSYMLSYLVLFMYSHHISTNDINYPILWNALSKEDKARLFHKRKTDCCMDHFLETVNCQIIDHCSSDTWSMKNAKSVYGKKW